MKPWRRRLGKLVCDRFGHRDRPYDGKSYGDCKVFCCARCDRLLRPRSEAHADHLGAMAQYPGGSWQLEGPLPMWVGWGMRIAECECGRQFTNYEAYMWHWHVQNRKRHG